MEEKNKIYTAADFANYHAGTMPANEMYSLERAALEDPFLSDALEGYAYAISPKDDIAKLHNRFTQKHKKKNIFTVASLADNKWWRVAAGFIITIGLGYFFYRTNNITTQNSLAKNNIKKSPSKVETPPLILKDTNATNNDVTFGNRAVPGVSKNKAVPPRTDVDREFEKKPPQTITSIDKNDGVSSGIAAINNPTDGIVLRKSINNIDTSKQYVLKGKVIDDSGAPIPFVSITTDNKRNETITDANGEFSLPSDDSTAKVIASALGYYPSKHFLLKKYTEPTITMNRSRANLDEVVVTGYSSKRKKALSSRSNELQGKVAGTEITKQSIQPFPVNEKFNQYIYDNLISVYNDQNEKVSGEVQLSFSINKKGRPQDISVLKSTCKECEEQAINLLETGPDWEGKKNILGSLEIRFK